MFDNAIIEEKPKEVLAVENVTLESDALTIIRLCKELLGITRGLKETWCLGTIKVTKDTSTKESDEVGQDIFLKFNELTDRVASLDRLST